MKRKVNYRRFLFGLLALAAVGVGILGYVQAKESIPDSYIQTRGGPGPGKAGLLVTQEVKPGLTEASVNAFATENYTVSYRYLGLLPLKEVEVQVQSPAYVIPGGVPIGIYMETQGILVVGAGTVTGLDGLNHEPAEGVVRSGDYIQTMNGIPISDKEELIERVNREGSREVVLELRRKGEPIQVKLHPIQTAEAEYRLGIWVRDNTQGIGTLTFITENQRFGALGHGINDVDTGELLELSGGALYDANIREIKRGEKGAPGELSGTIRYRPGLKNGEVTANTKVGIFGTCGVRLEEQLDGKRLEVGYKQEIQPGEAVVRSAVDGTLRDYQVEILEVQCNEEDVNKGIILKVTDPELLALTGGIIQGMSGSPILQNGKLVGAVTHVFVQDSAKGFGVFLENMLEHTDGI